MFNLLRFIGVANLRTRKFRTLVVVLAVAFGVALPAAIRIINRATLESLKENTAAIAGKASLTISAGQPGIPEEKLELIRGTPGVSEAVPMAMARGFFVGQRDSNTLLILGVDLLQDQSVRTYKTENDEIMEDPLVFLSQPDSIVLTREFAERNHLTLDSKLELATPQGKKRFTVRGLFSASGPLQAYGGAVAIMDIDGARFTFGKEGRFDRIDVITDPQADLLSVSRGLRSLLGSGYTVGPPEIQAESTERMIQSFYVVLRLFSQLALIIAFFLIGSSMATSVAERQREIGTLRALGASRQMIFLLFTLESALVGILGSLMGAGLGVLLARKLVVNFTQALSSQFVIQLNTPKLRYTWEEVRYSLVLGVGTALLAALWPALRATRVHPIEAIREHPLEASDFKPRGLVTHAALGAGAVLITFVVVSTVFLSKEIGAKLAALNAILAVIGVALVGPSLVSFVLQNLLGPTMRSKKILLSLSIQNLLRGRGRTAVNIITLITGLSFVTLIAAINTSFRQTITVWLDRIVSADLVVSSSGNIASFDLQPMSERLRDQISSIPGVRTIGQRYLQFTYEDRMLALKAFDEPTFEEGYRSFVVLDREPRLSVPELFSGGELTTMVSESFVKNFGKRTGDRVTLVTPSGTRTFKIVGVVTDFGSPNGVLYLSREVYKELWRDPNVSVYGVYVKSGVAPESIRAEIDRRFGASQGLITVSSQEIKSLMMQTIDQSFYYIRAVNIVALLVALFGLTSTLLMNVLERTSELGMLRAVGMSRRQLNRMILYESLLQGLLGAGAAILLGSWIAHFWMTHSLANALGWMIEFHYPWMNILTTGMEGILVAFVASLIPARRAATMEIAQALTRPI